MDIKIREIILKHKESIIEQWLEEISSFRDDEGLKNITDAMYEKTNREFVENLFVTVQTDINNRHKDLKVFTERLIQLGWPLNYITRGLQKFRKIIISTLSMEESLLKERMIIFEEIENWLDGIVNLLVSEYSGSWENTVFLQKMALKELSAPLIPVVDKISVMPLIGAIDTERAKYVMDNLLQGVIEHRSEVVLIDITGVPVVDTMVAHHIIRASEAVRLIGATCIIVGIRPEIAQTIINLGIDLSHFPTRSTLKKGFEAALELTRRKIISI